MPGFALANALARRWLPATNFSSRFVDFVGGQGSEDGFDGGFGLRGLGANYIQQEFEGRILTSQRDGGQEYGTEPRVRFFGEAVA